MPALYSVGGRNLVFNGHPDGSVDWTVMVASSKWWYHQFPYFAESSCIITGKNTDLSYLMLAAVVSRVV